MSWSSLWSLPEVASFHDSDGPFEEEMCLKLEHYNPDFHAKGGKKNLIVFPCLALETLAENALVKHDLEQLG